MSRIRRVCADPMKTHRIKVHLHTRKVTISILAKCAIELKKDSYLCVNCWKAVNKQFSSATSTETLLNQPTLDGIPLDEPSSGDTDSVRSNDSCADEMESNINISNILPLLAQTPVKKSKYLPTKEFVHLI